MEELIAQQAELIARLQAEVENLKSDLEKADITAEYRALYDRAAALLEVMTGARKPTQAECNGIEEAYQLSRWLDEYDI